MTLAGRKIAITGAGRSLGAALAIAAADRGALPILLGRSPAALEEIAKTIEARTGYHPDGFFCDLTDLETVASAAERIASIHADLDILVNSGAHWAPGRLEEVDDATILSIVNSSLSGTLALTKRLLPLLKARPHADIHTVVSMTGLPYARLMHSSLPFRAAKAGQEAFVQGLTQELADSTVRVTSIFPGHIVDMLPTDPAWTAARGQGDGLTDRDVVEAILYALDAPPNVALRSIVIEQARTEFFDWGSAPAWKGPGDRS